MENKNTLINQLNEKYPNILFTYNNVFFNYRCDKLNENEISSIEIANKEIKDSIIQYFKETQIVINELIDSEERVYFNDLNELSLSQISDMYFEHSLQYFPNLTLNVFNYPVKNIKKIAWFYFYILI